MNKKIVLVASLCLLLMAIAVSAQDKTASFAGDWELDVKKSDLGERSRVESMTMKVTQTDSELTVERKAKLAERQGNGGGGGGMGRGGGRGMGGGDQTFKYDLSGKETSAEMGGGRGGEAKLKASSEKDGKMKLTQTRSFESPQGSMTIKTTETWELSNDGKTLTVSSEMETPRGNRNSKMVFVKK